MFFTDKNIGIALSGGGIRATIFHLGVLKWLSEEQALENIKHISSVSGASICVGLLYSHNNYNFPNSSEYELVLNKVKHTILYNNIQILSIFELIKNPLNFLNKPKILSNAMKKYWNIKGKFYDLDNKARWSINATTVETGKRFSFSQKHIGDYKIGYINDLNYDISMAIAISAAFPILIGMHPFEFKSNNWVDYQNSPVTTPKSIHLWDGGVYDNLGIEAIYKMENSGKFKDGINFGIVSNASNFDDMYGIKKINIKRLLDIAMVQINSLRTRSYVDFISREKNGIYINIGNHANKILKCSSISDKEKYKLISNYDSLENCIKVKNYPTTLNSPNEEDFNLILNHGYQNAKYTYMSYYY